MRDPECTAFLQWALPRLGFRWRGFRKVRRQVCRRIRRRLAELALPDLEAYRRRLAEVEAEWAFLDSCCRISISRFYRDRAVFDRLGGDVLPALAQQARKRRAAAIRVWSAGCASGEEPYTLAILWRLAVAPGFPGLELSVVATDADPHLLERSRRAAYAAGSLRELPTDWRELAFRREGELFHLRVAYRRGIELIHQDIRREMPAGPFDLVLCRNLAFTYFDETVQREVLRRLVERLRGGGFLVVGGHETLPERAVGVEGAGRCFYRRA